MFRLKKLLIIAVLFILDFVPSSASHLMGGSLTYQYIGYRSSDSTYHYLVKAQLFRYCDSTGPGNPPAVLPDSLFLGIYKQDIANPNAVKQRYGNKVRMNSTNLSVVEPPTPGDSCNFTTTVCVQEGDYQADIYLPASSGGYHLLIELCCRNYNIINLDNPPPPQPPTNVGVGQSYYAFIPPNPKLNSSPVFAEIPVPFICVGDTISVVNSAIDPDGDVLVYSFVVPYNSFDNNAIPTPGPTITMPLPTVPYASGYSFNQPFGSGGFAGIDSASGLTQYYIPDEGFYVVCIQVDEYRSGVLIASTRRDLQLIAIPCPLNPPPVLSNAGGSGITVYNIIEGQPLCFPITMTDPNGDSVFVHSAGLLFDSTLVNPYATLANTSGKPSATSQFCWNTVCGQGRTAPYQFTVSARDNGCPPKISNVVYSINVRPFKGPLVINGPDSVCILQTGTAYTVQQAAGNVYHWSVTNGTQSSGGNNSGITIDWTNSASGSIAVFTVSQYGCISDTISKTVILKPLPTADAGSDVTFCSGQNAFIGNPPQTGYTYAWNPALGLSSIISSQPSVTLTNGNIVPVSNPYVLLVTLNGCSDQDTAQVTVKPLPFSEAGVNRSSCSGDTVHLGTSTTSGYTYSWSPSTGLSSTTLSNPDIVVSNITSSPFTLLFHVTTTLNNCVTEDSIQLIVNPLPLVNATSSPDTICEGQIASLHGFGASTYNWANSLNPGLSIGSGTNLNVSPTITTTYIVTGTSSANCMNKDTVTLIESPLPNVQATALPDSVCKGNSSTLTATGASGYWWAPLQLPNDTIGTGTTLTVIPDSSISHIVTGINAFGCINKDTVRLTLNPAPLVDSVFGNQSICPGVTGVGYIAFPFTSTSTYQWIIQHGTIGSGQGFDTVYVGWDSISGPGSISVVEITNHFCISDTVTLPVDINVILSPATPFGITPICEENADSIVYSTFNTPGSTYTWQVINGTILNGNGTNTVAINWDSTGVDMGVIWYLEHSVTVDTFCNGISDTLYVTIHKRPVTSSILGTTSLCAFEFGAAYTVLPDSASVYQWTLTDGAIIQGNGTNSIHVNWGQAGTETLSVTETNYFGCVGRRMDTTVVIYPVPQSLFSASFKPTCQGLEAKLLDASTNELNYSWLFGDGTQLSDSNVLPSDTVTHVYPFGSSGEIMLVAINNICRDTSNFPLPEIGLDDALDSLPNIFTPNGDGVNDCFQITPAGGLNDCATLTIFNRWGRIVFEGDTQHRCWNGKNPGGVDCDEGVYFFTLKVGSAARNGFVQLLRK